MENFWFPRKSRNSAYIKFHSLQMLSGTDISHKTEIKKYWISSNVLRGIPKSIWLSVKGLKIKYSGKHQEDILDPEI